MVIPDFRIISYTVVPPLIMPDIANPNLKNINNLNTVAKNIVGTIHDTLADIYNGTFETARLAHKIRTKEGTFDHGLGTYKFE